MYSLFMFLLWGIGGNGVVSCMMCLVVVFKSGELEFLIILMLLMLLLWLSFIVSSSFLCSWCCWVLFG